jgi:alpha-D-ribose 1-methylphosphonate 5-triphosphate synthase subunit PhnH
VRSRYHANVVDYLRFHCGAPIVADPAEADFALITRPLDMPELRAFNPGNAEYPDRSTTLIIQVAELRTDAGWRLQGPGIAGHLEFEAAPLPASFKAQLQDNHDRYPMGVDIVLASGRALAALPRSARPSED